MKTGKHINTQFSGDKRRNYTIEFEECTIEFSVLFTSELIEDEETGTGGEYNYHEIMDMDIFTIEGDRVHLSSINEEELYTIIEPLINY